MKIIVGLGNPGEKYKNNRHNAGFMAVDFVIGNWKLEIGNFQNNFNSLIWETSLNDDKIILAKPQTFMNESGKAVQAICDFYKAKPRSLRLRRTTTGVDVTNDLLVLHDDTDLPLGTIRTTTSSSSAGHNGVKSIIGSLGTQNFHRIRIGVESRASRNDLPTDAFVLQNFTDDELEKLKFDILPKVKSEIERFSANK